MSNSSPWTRGHPSGELLSTLVDGEVEADVRAELEVHVQSCSECRVQVDSFRALRLTLRSAPLQRAPMSLNREVWQRIEAHDANSRRWFRLPASERLVGIATNALALAAIAVLIAIIEPGAHALFLQLLSPTTIDEASTAAQPTVPSSGVFPTLTPWPTQTAVAATPTAARATEVPTVASKEGAISDPIPQDARPPTVVPKPVQAVAPKSEPTPAPKVSIPSVVPTSAPHTPTLAASAPALRTVSGTISFVDRKAKTITVTSNGPSGERSVSVVLSDGTQYSRADGRKTTFEDVGIADQVEVSGFDSSALANAMMASSVRVSVSAVVSAAQARVPRILFVADGAESIRAGQYGLTGDWARRLASTGYEVTTADPARVAWTASTLKGFDLVVIGSPATLSDVAISVVKSSRLPILDADPRLVQTLGLGVNVDPANPLRQAPIGRTIDIVASGSIVTRGLATGETVVAREAVYRTPIVSNGTVLATVLDGGQRRAVWTQTGTSMYLGAWNSASGANHTDAYWSMFDRSVVALLGRDPSSRVGAPSPSPTATRTIR